MNFNAQNFTKVGNLFYVFSASFSVLQKWNFFSSIVFFVLCQIHSHKLVADPEKKSLKRKDKGKAKQNFEVFRIKEIFVFLIKVL